MALTFSRLLHVSLTIQRSLKVNISDDNVEYSTSRIVYITRSNMSSVKFKIMARYVKGTHKSSLGFFKF
jgi:hypothetical protein